MPVAAKLRNTRAIEHTIAALRSTGRIEAVDAATVALIRHLAAALDDVDPVTCPAQVASLARVQLVALKMLRGVNVDADSGLSDLVAALQSPLGDAPDA